jgi:tetratricopeptide (TPR) repeat protein
MKSRKKEENVQKLKEAQDAFNEGKKIINTSASEADIYRAIDKFSEAIKLLREGSYTHNASKFYSSRGNAFMRIKRFEEAEKDFNNAIAQDGKNSSSYLNSLGKCKLEMSEALAE